MPRYMNTLSAICPMVIFTAKPVNPKMGGKTVINMVLRMMDMLITLKELI